MKSVILSFFILCNIAAKAQTKIPLYLRLEMNQSNVKNSDSRIQKGPGAINLGAGIETIIPLIKSKKNNFLALNPSLSYLPTGYQTENSTYKVKVNYLSVNLPLSYFIDAGNFFNTIFGSSSYSSGEGYLFYLGAGPYFNYALSGKYMLTSIDDYKKMSFGNGINDNRTTTDGGLIIKTGIKTPKFLVGVQYNIGGSNVIPKDRISNGSYIKTKSFLLTVSYKISKK